MEQEEKGRIGERGTRDEEGELEKAKENKKREEEEEEEEEDVFV